jgi:hypothetical protein
MLFLFGSIYLLLYVDDVGAVLPSGSQLLFLYFIFLFGVIPGFFYFVVV